MNYRRLFQQFPKWVIALTILVVSTTLFSLWWIFGERNDQTPNPDPRDRVEIDSEEDEDVEPTPPSFEIGDGVYLLQGSNLYQFRNGAIEFVSESWLDGTLGKFDRPIFLKNENVLIIGSKETEIRAFASNGQRIGSLSLSSGGNFDGYVTRDYLEAVFLREGNLWRGQIDWPNAKVVNETQATNLGYIQGRPLKGRLLGSGRNTVVYRDHRYGILGINLETGATQPLQFPANIIPSPSGELIVGDTPTRPPQLVVFDISELAYATYPIEWRVQQDGFAWMGVKEAAVLLGDQLLRYDHEERSLTPVYRTENRRGRLAFAAVPRPKESHILVQDSAKGLLRIDMTLAEVEEIQTPPANHVHMLTGGSFLLSSDVPNSEYRGTWLFRKGSETPTKIFAQPMVVNRGINLQTEPPIQLSESHFLMRALGGWHLLDVTEGTTQEVKIENSTEPIRMIEVSN